MAPALAGNHYLRLSSHFRYLCLITRNTPSVPTAKTSKCPISIHIRHYGLPRSRHPPNLVFICPPRLHYSSPRDMMKNALKQLGARNCSIATVQERLSLTASVRDRYERYTQHLCPEKTGGRLCR